MQFGTNESIELVFLWNVKNTNSPSLNRIFYGQVGMLLGEKWYWHLTIIHGMWRCMYVPQSLENPCTDLDQNRTTYSPWPPNSYRGSWSRSSKVKGHLGVKSWNLQESSTEVTRGHFKVTTIFRKPHQNTFYPKVKVVFSLSAPAHQFYKQILHVSLQITQWQNMRIMTSGTHAT